MEKKTRKRLPSKTPPVKERRDSVKGRAGTRPTESISKKSPIASETCAAHINKLPGIPLNAETARQAVILSEIIGKPVSKRRK